MKNTIKLQFTSVNNIVRRTAVGKGDSYMLQWGENNEFPDYLKFLYEHSSKHKSIIDHKTLYMSGEEPDGFIEACIKDYNIFGGFAFLVSKKQGLVDWYQHVNYERVRKLEDGRFVYSDKFVINNSQQPGKFYKNSRAKITIYEDFRDIRSDGIGLVYYSNTDTYPIPDYIGALNYIELDYRISNFWLNSIKNNFSFGYVVTYNKPEPISEDDKRRDYDALKELFAGDDNAGAFMVQYAPTGEKAINIDRLDLSDFDQKFNLLNSTIQQEIFVAHKVTSPMLFGIRTEGQLGGRSELVTAYNIFYRSYIVPQRNKVLDILTKILDKEFEVVDLSPITDDMTQYKDILTINEMRDIIGYEPIKDGNSIGGVQVNIEQDDELIKDKAVSLLRKTPTSLTGKYTLIASSHLEGVPNELTELDFANEYAQLLITPTIEMVLNTINMAGSLKQDLVYKVTQLDKDSVDKIINYLLSNGLIVRYNDILTITEKGKEALKQQDLTKVVYSYEWIEGFSDANLDTSRDFCKRMRNESKTRMAKGYENLWTIEDINSISTQLGYDVWSMRGGWYRIPKTNISVPHCRHTWKQHIIRKEV